MANKMELKLWQDEEDNFNCELKGTQNEVSECIATLMQENKVFAGIVTCAVLAYEIEENKKHQHG